jgi:hypothetical protein
MSVVDGNKSALNNSRIMPFEFGPNRINESQQSSNNSMSANSRRRRENMIKDRMKGVY